MMVSDTKAVAAAGRFVEAHLIAGGEAGDQRSHAVRIPQIEVRVLRERTHSVRRIGQRRHRLDGEPLVQHQIIAMPARMESVECRAPFGAVDCRQHRQSREHVGHVLPCIELRLCPRNTVGITVRRKVHKACIAQCSPANRGPVNAVRPRIGQSLIRCTQCSTQCAADCRTRSVTHGMDSIDIRHSHLVSEERLTRQCQRLGRERRISIGIAQRGSQGIDQSLFERRRLAPSPVRGHPQQQMRGILLAELPAHKWIGIVRGEVLQLRKRNSRQLRWRGKATQQ